MKLTDIDLNDKTEVAAAHALLAAVLGAPHLQRVLTDADAAADLAGTPRPAPTFVQTTEQNPAAVFAQPGTLPADAQPLQDAAAVFGASPLGGATGLPATSAQVPASGLPINGGASVAPAAGGQLPQSFVSAEGAAAGLQGLGQPATGVELDSRGLPWDGRIHASTKSKKKDGAWTALRGLNDEAKVKQIEAELRASVQGSAAPLGVAPGVAASIPAAPAVVQSLPGLSPAPASNVGQQPPGIASSSTLPGGTAPPVSADPVTFEQLMPRVTQATIAGVLPPTALQQVCGALGLPSVVALQTNPAYVPHAWVQLKAAYPALQ